MQPTGVASPKRSDVSMHSAHLKADPYRTFSKAEHSFLKCISFRHCSFSERNRLAETVSTCLKRLSISTFLKVMFQLQENANVSENLWFCFVSVGTSGPNPHHRGKKIQCSYSVSDSTTHLKHGQAAHVRISVCQWRLWVNRLFAEASRVNERNSPLSVKCFFFF